MVNAPGQFNFKNLLLYKLKQALIRQAKRFLLRTNLRCLI